MNDLNEPNELEPAVAVDEHDSPVDAPAPAVAVRILKVDACPSVSGRSVLTYHLGWRDSELVLRLYRNTAKGMFCKDWLRWCDVDALLDSGAGITSGLLQRLYEGRSANSGGFLLAVLKHEGLVQSQPESLRTHERLDDSAFLLGVHALVEAGVDVPEDTLPACLAPASSKKGRRSVGTSAKTSVETVALDGEV